MARVAEDDCRTVPCQRADAKHGHIVIDRAGQGQSGSQRRDGLFRVVPPVHGEVAPAVSQLTETSSS